MIQKKIKERTISLHFFKTSVCCWTNKRRIDLILQKDVVYAHTKKILEKEKGQGWWLLFVLFKKW